jgi:hypothetical protein
MTAEACLFVASSWTRRRRQLLRGMLWPASARFNGASRSVYAPDPCLLAPADDRNALVTTAGGIVLAVCICTLKPILAATPARSISLPRPAMVQRCAPSETKNEGRLWPRASVSRPQIHPRAVGNVHRAAICRELSDSNQLIKSEHGGTLYARDHPPSFSIGCPTDPVDVVTAERQLVAMRWGLVPWWWNKPLKELRAAILIY